MSEQSDKDTHRLPPPLPPRAVRRMRRQGDVPSGDVASDAGQDGPPESCGAKASLSRLILVGAVVGAMFMLLVILPVWLMFTFPVGQDVADYMRINEPERDEDIDQPSPNTDSSPSDAAMPVEDEAAPAHDDISDDGTSGTVSDESPSDDSERDNPSSDTPETGNSRADDTESDDSVADDSESDDSLPNASPGDEAESDDPAKSTPPHDLKSLPVVLSETGNVLELPKAEIGARRFLAKVDVKNPDVPRKCDIRLLGQELVFGKEGAFRVDRANNNGEASWTIVFKKVYGPIREALEEPACAFYLKDQTLSFEWLSDSPRASNLRYCSLVFIDDDVTRTCQLFRPYEFKAQPIDLRHKIRDRRVEGAFRLPALDQSLCKNLATHLRFKIDVTSSKDSIHAPITIVGKSEQDAQLTFTTLNGDPLADRSGDPLAAHNGIPLATLDVNFAMEPTPRLGYEVFYHLPKDFGRPDLENTSIDLGGIEAKRAVWETRRKRLSVTAERGSEKALNRHGQFLKNTFPKLWADMNSTFQNDGYPPPDKLIERVKAEYDSIRFPFRERADGGGRATTGDAARQEAQALEFFEYIKGELQPYSDQLNAIERGIAIFDDIITFANQLSEQPLASVWIYLSVPSSDDESTPPFRVDLVRPAVVAKAPDVSEELER